MGFKSPFSSAFSFTALSGLFLWAGFVGYNLSRHDRFVAGTAWPGHVIWWEVAIGFAAIPFAAYFWRKALRSA